MSGNPTRPLALDIIQARGLGGKQPPEVWPEPQVRQWARSILRQPVLGTIPAELAWTHWPKLRSPVGSTHHGEWADLVAQIDGLVTSSTAKAKPELPGWGPVVCDGGKRADGAVQSIHALVLDCDGHGSWSTLLDIAESHHLAMLIHSSPGADGAVHKWRAVLPLAAPIAGDALRHWQAYYGAARMVFGALGKTWFDPACYNPSRLWFAGRVEGTAPRLVQVHEGAAIDVVALFRAVEDACALPLPQMDGPRPAPSGRPALHVVGPTGQRELSAVERAERWIARRDPAIQGSGGDQHTYATAAKLVVDFDLGDADALRLLGWWNARCVPPWSDAELVEKLAHARKYGKRSRGEALSAPVYVREASGMRSAVGAEVAPGREPDDAEEAEETQDEVPVIDAGRIAFPVVYQSGAREGRPVSCIENLRALLAHYGASARYNLMLHRAEVVVGGVGTAERRNNASTAQVREWARRAGLPTGRSFEDQLELVIQETAWHPVADWIASRPWDGVDRFERIFQSLTLAPAYAATHTHIARAMLRAWMVSAAKAALTPSSELQGINAQGILVLQGPQGVRKTRWIGSLAPKPMGCIREGYLLDPGSRDSVQQAMSFWIVELGELDATLRKADVAALKALVTSSSDTFRSAYERREETIARRTVFAASVNEVGYIHDTTGGRRFWTIQVLLCDPNHGVDVQQLWAQMAQVAVEDPAAMYLPPEVERELAELNTRYSAIDPVGDMLAERWEIDESETCWESLRGVCNGIDSDRAWSSADKRQLSRALRERLKAPERTSRGYAQWAVVRRP